MAISKESKFALIEARDQVAETNVNVVYVVDSFGATGFFFLPCSEAKVH